MTQARKQADSQRAPHGRLLEADAGQFRNNFNVRSFMFRHNMCGHPLFQLPRLATLAGKESTVVTKFTAMPQERRLADTVRGLQDSSSWLKISSADVADPEYGA